MVHKTFLSLLFSMILIGLSFPLSAQAEFNGNTLEFEILEDSLSLFPRSFYTIDLFNDPHVSETKFTLRLSSYGEVSGCASMSESELKTKEVGDTIKLLVYDSEIELDEDTPRYTNYDCEIKRNRSFFDVELDRDELIKKKIEHIALTSEVYGEFITSDIKIDQYKIELTAKTSRSTSMITYWFYPKNTVILHAPKAKLGQDVQELIRKFGVSKGLVPMEDAYDKFELPYNAYSFVIFKDPGEYIFKQLDSVGANVTVGKIKPTRTVYGANGPVEELYNLDIYATLPAQQK